MDRRHLLKRAGLLVAPLSLGGMLRPHRTGAQDSEPVGPQALDLLRYVPAGVLEDLGGNPLLATVADPASRAAAAGVDVPTDRDDEPAFGDWSTATNGLLLTSPFYDTIQPEWREAFGWDGFAVDRSLEFGQPPTNAQVYQGRFDPEAIGAALLAGDYAEVELDGAAAAWSRAEDGDIDLSTDAGRMALGGMNNVALLPDGALITARTLASLTATVETGTGDRPALTDVPFVETLVAAHSTHGSPLDSAVLLPGTSLVTSVDPGAVLTATAGEDLDEVADAVATQMAEQNAQGEMPPILLALAGTTGLDPELRACYTLLLPSPDAAASAVGVITDRLATGASVADGQPWTDLVAGWTVATAPGAPVVLVELATDRRSLWVDLIVRRDVGFLSW